MSVGQIIFDGKAWDYIDDVYEAAPVEHLINSHLKMLD
jgi:hypothetical protein